MECCSEEEVAGRLRLVPEAIGPHLWSSYDTNSSLLFTVDG